MKKLLLAILAVVFTLELAGCSSSANSKDVLLEGPSHFDHPDVVAPHDMLNRAIKEHELPFSLGHTGGSIDGSSNIEFFFKMTYDDAINDQILTVSILAFDNVVQRGFRIQLDPDCEDYVITDAIVCAILAVDPDLNYDDAKEYYDQLLVGYSGTGRSEVIVLNGYRLHISEEWPGYVLHVISEDNVYPGNEIEKYQPYVIDELQDTENYGDYVKVTTIIDDVKEDGDYYVLEVAMGDQTVGIYCKADVFAKCFSFNVEYNFYCEVARPREEYDVCLKLNSFLVAE